MKKEQLIKQFNALSFDQKKEKVIGLLNTLKESDKVFMDALKYIKVLDIEEQYLDKIYNDIIELWTTIFQKKETDKTEIIKQKIKRINEQEAKEKESDLLDFNF